MHTSSLSSRTLAEVTSKTPEPTYVMVEFARPLLNPANCNLVGVLRWDVAPRRKDSQSHCVEVRLQALSFLELGNFFG